MCPLLNRNAIDPRALHGNRRQRSRSRSDSSRNRPSVLAEPDQLFYRLVQVSIHAFKHLRVPRIVTEPHVAQMRQLRVEVIIHRRNLHSKQSARLVFSFRARKISTRQVVRAFASAVSWRQRRSESIGLLVTREGRARRSQREAELLGRLGRQVRRLFVPRSHIRACAARVLSGSRRIALGQRFLVVLLADVPLHCAVHLIGVHRNVRPYILRVVDLVACDIAHLFHIVDLLSAPAVHGEGLDLGHVSTQLPVQRGTAHTQEDAQVPRCPSGVLGRAVCASVVSWNRADEVLEGALVAGLLALADGARHGVFGIVILVLPMATERRAGGTEQDTRDLLSASGFGGALRLGDSEG